MGDEIHLNIQRARREGVSGVRVLTVTRQQPSAHLEDSNPHHDQHTKEDDGSILASAGAGRLDNEIDHGTVIKMCVPYSGTADTRPSPGRRHFLVTTFQHLYFRETVMSSWSEQRTSIIQ